MSTSNLTNLSILNLLKQQFSNFSYIKKIEIYKEVAYLEVKTDLLFFALEFRENGSIEIVFRDNETLHRFTEFFRYPFVKGSMIYFAETCVNHIFNLNNRLSDNKSYALLEKAQNILAKCLEVESEQSIWLHASHNILKNLCETETQRFRNEVLLDMNDFMHGKMLSMMQTMQKIKNEELSIARFGDGEINCMVTKLGCGFQTHDWKLMQELRNISSEENKLLVCYPSLMVECPWWAVYWPKYWAKCKFFLQKNTYGDSFITRPEAFHMHGHMMADLWKDIWNNKKVCFITGEGSRMNANHFIFDNIKDSQHVFSKPQNAYSDIENTIKKCQQTTDIDIFLIALGPAGTAIASRLHKLGYRALDIGHLNNSYDTVFNNAPRPERQ